MKRPVAVRGVAISPVSTKIGVEPNNSICGMLVITNRKSQILHKISVSPILLLPPC